jgi:hypothetical protein
MMEILLFILKNYYKEILLGCAAIIFGLVVYWFGFHIPSQLETVKAELRDAQIKVEQAQKALQLVDDIQKGRVKVDKLTFQRLSSIRVAPIPHNSVVVPGGVLPRMR